MKTKKIPMRSCLGCGAMKPKKEMIRVVKAPDGSVSIDFTGKKSGRGPYICREAECFRTARKARRFEKSLSCKIEDNVYEEIENEFTDND